MGNTNCNDCKTNKDIEITITKQSKSNKVESNELKYLIQLGFDKHAAKIALEITNNNPQIATQYLVDPDFIRNLNYTQYQHEDIEPNHSNSNDKQYKNNENAFYDLPIKNKEFTPPSTGNECPLTSFAGSAQYKAWICEHCNTVNS